MKKIPSPQLHSESEVLEIQRLASQTRKNGVIVEIGTYLGGTTNLLRNASDESVQIHTIDINQDILPTKDFLTSKNIHFHSGSSVDISRTWNQQIDFLFIDGGHRLIDTYNDYYAYWHYLTESSSIAFHDYDEPIAGGIYYIGVKIFVDTLIRIGALIDISQHTSLISGKVDKTKRKPTIEDIYQTLELQSKKTIEITSHYLKNANDLFNYSTKISRTIETAPIIDYKKTNPTSKQNKICEHLNQFYMCYIADELIKTNPSKIEEITGSPPGLYLEMMLWLDAERRISYPHTCAHADIYGENIFPKSLELYDLSSIEKISRFLTLEQVRLNMISRISNKIFDRLLSHTEEYRTLRQLSEKIIKEDLNVVIYGMNDTGQTLYNLLQAKDKTRPFGVIDRSITSEKYNSTNVLKPHELTNPDIQLVIIAARASSQHIIQEIQNMDVAAQTISLHTPEDTTKN